MRKTSFNINTISYLFILGIFISFSSCKDDVNDWSVDENADRIFSPVIFEPQNTEATSVDLRFSSVPNAKTYVFEFSQDSLEFNSIVSTLEIAAENIILDTTATSTTKAYLATEKNLTAETRYSARLKVLSNNGLPESKWVECTFKTGKEQILDAISEITESSAVITWTSGLEVTNVKLKEEPNVDGTSKDTKLTSENITNSKFTITGLKENTTYTIEIYNDKLKRGSRTFTTEEAMPIEGVKHIMKASDDIVEYLNNIADENVLLVIPAAASYEITDSWTIPSHIKTLILWGRTEAGKESASITLKEIKLDNSVSNFKIRLHNLNLTGTDASGAYVMNDKPSESRTISELKIDKCTLSTFRGVFRGQSSLNIDKIDIDNCIIYNIGSYGLISIDATTVNANNINISNSTAYSFTGANLISTKSLVNTLNIDHCTFYDIQASGKYVLNCDKVTIPSSFLITNSIFSASDASISVKGTNPKETGTFVRNSFKTSDYNINSGNPLTGIEDYVKPSTSLFKDPAKSDFTIIDTNIGDNQPGDPRWW